MYVINVLTKLVNRWVKGVTYKKSHGGEMFEEATIVVGGSWRMGKFHSKISLNTHVFCTLFTRLSLAIGVDTPDSDLDIACLVPYFVTRCVASAFFKQCLLPFIHLTLAEASG